MNSGNCKLQKAYSNIPALLVPGIAGKLLNTFLRIKEYFYLELFIIILFCNKIAKPSSLKGLIRYSPLLHPCASKKREKRAQQGKEKGKLALGSVCFSLLCVSTSGPKWEVHQTKGKKNTDTEHDSNK